MKLLIKILIAFILMTSVAWGATYYVSQSGDGDGSAVGTPDSIADFNADVFGELDGDTVYFLDAITTGINTPDAGISGSLIYLRGDYPGSECTITNASGSGIVIDEQYVSVSGFTVEVADDTDDRFGIYVHAANSIVNDNTIVGEGTGAVNTGHYGIYVLDAADSVISDNNISHVTNGIQYYTASAGYAGLCDGNVISDLDVHDVGTGDGIQVSGDAVYDYTGLIISNNSISEFVEDGIDLYYGANVVVQYNTVGPSTTAWDNGEQNGVGIKLGSSPVGSTGNIIRNNLIKNIAHTTANKVNYGIMSNSTDNPTIHNNLVYGCEYGINYRSSLGGYIYNNTFDASVRGIYVGYNTGPELHVSANAASDPNSNEADATTGWGVGGSAGSIASVADPQTGTYALKMTSGDAGAERAELSITVASGSIYRVKFWAKQGAQGTSCGVQSWTGVVTSPSEEISTASYALYSYDVTTNSTTLLIRIYASDPTFGPGGASGDEVLFDNLSVTLLDAVTVQNNIVSGDSIDLYSATSGAIVGGWNLLKNDASVTTYQDGSYVNTDTSDIYATDPLFISATNFHLMYNSPAIGAGLDLGSTYSIGLGGNDQLDCRQSDAWDLGALPYCEGGKARYNALGMTGGYSAAGGTVE